VPISGDEVLGSRMEGEFLHGLCSRIVALNHGAYDLSFDEHGKGIRYEGDPSDHCER
jgi:hypothetical protein